MKKTFLFSFLAMAVTAMAGQYTQYVNPFIGTGAVANSLSGNCYPGATVPFGMVQLSPDTQQAPDWDKASGYDYNDRTIYGFSHTRLSGTGASDLIDILLMPTTDGTAHSAYSHADEEAAPGYYRVRLDDSGINAELSATVHTGIHRYTYPSGKTQQIILDMDHSAQKGSWNRRIIQSQIRVVSPTVVEGYRIITGWAKLRRVYFHMELSRPIASYVLTDGERKANTVINGTELKALFTLGGSSDEVVCKVALSTVSVENARLNMETEAGGWDFDTYRINADKDWDVLLGRIDAEADADRKQIFYTAMYHALIQPNQMSDVNGEYTATDYTTRRMPGGEKYYTTFSLWDTFRAAHPLYTIIAPEQNKAFVASMLAHFDTYGYLPIWDLWGQDNYCMIGNHAVPVVVDAYLKGQLPKSWGGRILKAVEQSLTVSHPGSPFDVWEKYGYMPENLQSQSVSITLEQSFDDWCGAQLAKRLGRNDLYDRLISRSRSFRNLHNAASGFFQAKDDKGKWLEPFDPLQYGANGGNPFTEGNAWQYYWYVPHDIDGLIALTGGNRKFVERLDRFFTLNERSGDKNDNASGFIGQYVHGNEPSHHVAYLYDYAGHPRRTQELVQKIMREMYNTSSSGYAGNDDCGEMSAWYVFSAMGFYPVNPAGGEYAIGSPVLDRATVNMPNGRKFTVEVRRKSPQSVYIRSMKLNGKPYKKYTLSHADIEAGGVLSFELTDR